MEEHSQNCQQVFLLMLSFPARRPLLRHSATRSSGGHQGWLAAIDHGATN